MGMVGRDLYPIISTLRNYLPQRTHNGQTSSKKETQKKDFKDNLLGWSDVIIKENTKPFIQAYQWCLAADFRNQKNTF